MKSTDTMNIFVVTFLVLVAFFGSTKGQSDGDVRLFDNGQFGTDRGVVEIFHNGEWGTVCSTSRWNIYAADVVCRQLNYRRNAMRLANPQEFNYPYPHRIWLDGIDCSGSEGTLVSCQHWNWGHVQCSQDDVAAVECPRAKKELQDDDLRSRAAELLLELMKEAKKPKQ